ncbi:uncharacterized protein [Watersipora subatra]|uniref:uncharacterized protein n=1 Tax=Watersipora subatra TaxID=2589382 RepID=UPI00355C4393
MERISKNSGVLIFIVVLLINLFAVNSQCSCVACEPCKRASYTTYNFWIEPPGTRKREIHKSGTEFSLRLYQTSAHEDYAFLTRFYECENGKGTWISTEIKGTLLANSISGSQCVDQRYNDPGAQPCHCHPALFKFENGSSEALGLLRSVSRGFRQFLDRSESRLSFSVRTTKWEALPALTKRISSAERLTEITMADGKYNMFAEI